MAHKQKEGGGWYHLPRAVTFGKYGFTLTESKLSPHEQKLWPLAIRRGGGGWVTVWADGLVWLGFVAFIVAWTFCHFAILDINYRLHQQNNFISLHCGFCGQGVS